MYDCVAESSSSPPEVDQQFNQYSTTPSTDVTSDMICGEDAPVIKVDDVEGEDDEVTQAFTAGE